MEFECIHMQSNLNVKRTWDQNLILACAQYQGERAEGVGLAGAEGGHFLIIIKPALLLLKY